MSDNIIEFSSQHFQDVFIYRNLINQKNNGIFVEIGGNDGITYSNSLFFEKYLGFTGMLIEPIPDSFEAMKKSRPNCKCLNYCISETDGVVDFCIPNNCTLMGGIQKSMPDEYTTKKTFEIIQVPSIPLYKILNKDVYQYIDIFFIDVEGGELNVLKTIDWNIKIYIICIELDGLNQEKDEECRQVLRENGFEQEVILQMNAIWVNNKNKRKDLYVEKDKELFTKPTVVNKECSNKDGSYVQCHEGFIQNIYYLTCEYEKEHRNCS
jgi:FkbM family methyltransferase